MLTCFVRTHGLLGPVPSRFQIMMFASSGQDVLLVNSSQQSPINSIPVLKASRIIYMSTMPPTAPHGPFFVGFFNTALHQLHLRFFLKVTICTAPAMCR